MRRLAAFLCVFTVASLGVTGASAASPPWTMHTTGAFAGMSAVGARISCVDDGFCVGVSGATITMFSNGHVTRTLAAPFPEANTDPHAFVNLQAVSCTSATDCVAVGNYTPHSPNQAPVPGHVSPASSSGTYPVIETWARGVWAAAILPQNPGAILDSVACNADHCLTVGTEADEPHTPVLATRTGGAWAQQQVTFPVQVPTYAGDVSYAAPACPASGGSCVLSAIATDVDLNTGLYFAFQSGSGYKAVRDPIPAGADPSTMQLTSMSCVSSTECTGLGFYGSGSNTHVLAEALVGGQLESESVPDTTAPIVAGAGTDTAITCVTTDACYGVAAFHLANRSRQSVLLRHYKGSWRARVAPRVAIAGPGPISNYATSVACVTALSCTVAGDAYSSTAQQAEVWSFNGGAWSVSTPTVSGGHPVDDTFLNSIACSGRSCYAFGGGSSPESSYSLVAEGRQLPVS